MRSFAVGAKCDVICKWSLQLWNWYWFYANMGDLVVLDGSFCRRRDVLGYFPAGGLEEDCSCHFTLLLPCTVTFCQLPCRCAVHADIVNAASRRREPCRRRMCTRNKEVALLLLRSRQCLRWSLPLLRALCMAAHHYILTAKRECRLREILAV